MGKWNIQNSYFNAALFYPSVDYFLSTSFELEFPILFIYDKLHK